MRYPLVNSWLTYKRIDEDWYLVEDEQNGLACKMNGDALRLLSRLDGKTDPHEIAPGVSAGTIDQLVSDLEDRGFVRRSRALRTSAGTVLWTLFLIRERPGLKKLACWFNRILMLSWLPVLLLGIWVYASLDPCLPDISDGWVMVFALLGSLVGVLPHELGHACAGMAYGAPVYEIGLMIRSFLPGAYTMMEDRDVKSPLRRVQIMLAGVEAGFFLSGIAFVAAGLLESMFLFCIAVSNIVTGVFNLSAICGSDGGMTLGILLGRDDIAAKAASVVRCRRKRRRLLKGGEAGTLTVASCYLLSALQVALPCIYLLSVWSVLEVVTS